MQLPRLLLAIITVALIAGCGGGDSSLSSVSSAQSSNKLAESSKCLNCHATVLSPGTGALIADEWRASVHNLRNGAGCADCHEPAMDHPNQCGTCHGGGEFQVTANPDAASKCLKCHGPSHPSDALMALAPQHFGYSTAQALPQTTRASYVSGQYQGRCRACHNTHNNTLTQQHRDYATSLHGDPKGVAWSSRDFKQYGACIRCHTSTGYIGYIGNNFTAPSTGFGAGDPTRQVLACDACHASYDFKNSIRQVPAFTATYKGYDGTTLGRFPNVGETNICIPCHSGREGGATINAITDFSNASFVSPHYMAAVGLMYMQNGFTNFTSAAATIGTSTYGKTLSPDDITTPGGMVGGTSSTHRKFGTPLINGDAHNPTVFIPGAFDKNGPCVTCHMNASGVAVRSGNGHSLKIDANAYNQVCRNCHTSENGLPIDASNFLTQFVEPNKVAFQDSLKLIQVLLLRNFHISFNQSSHPYFYDEDLPAVNGKKQPVKDWTRGGTANGRKLMGACYNLSLLTGDPAAFAHARTYSRRLVYDSIDFLDDGVINLSVGATALAQSLLGTSPADNLVFGLFTQGTKAYNSGALVNGKYGISTPAAGTSEAMLYLIGWNRSGATTDAAGAWTSPERP